MIMTQPPLISIIIPVHNTENFLADCLNSVISQSYRNIEIIVMNDNSSDDSERVIRAQQKKDKRIKYFYTVQNNAALTRREGVERSTADYICFLDSDDIINEKYIEILYNTLKKTNTEIATAKICNFTHKNELPATVEGKYTSYVEDDVFSYFCNNYFSDQENRHIAQSINAKMFTKNLLKKIDYSVIKTTILEDNYIVPQILKYSNPQKISIIDSTLYYYRRNPNSTMAGSLSRMIDYDGVKISYPQLFEKTMEYIQELYADYKNINLFIYKIKTQKYYDLAKSVVDKNIHIKSLVIENEKLTQSNKYYKERVDNILSSKSYKMGRIVTIPIRFLKHLIGRLSI